LPFIGVHVFVLRLAYTYILYAVSSWNITHVHVRCPRKEAHKPLCIQHEVTFLRCEVCLSVTTLLGVTTQTRK